MTTQETLSVLVAIAIEEEDRAVEKNLRWNLGLEFWDIFEELDSDVAQSILSKARPA